MRHLCLVKLDHRYRKSIQPLLESGEELRAAPMTGAWASGAASELPAATMAGRMSRSKGVAGRLIAAQNLSFDDILLLDEMAAATDRRILFMGGATFSIRPKAKEIASSYPIGNVLLSWADGSIAGRKWKAFCFHLPDGKWWALESSQGSSIRKPPNDEAALMVEAFGDRAHQVSVE